MKDITEKDLYIFIIIEAIIIIIVGKLL